MDVVFDNFDVFVAGFRTTVQLSVIGYVLAFVIGTVIAAFRVSPVPPLRAVGTFYVETVRNTPLTVLFVLIWFGLPKIELQHDSRFVTACIVLGIYTGAFAAETVRSGINSVAVGQAEAARSLGLTFPQVLLIVIMPQALRTVVAPLGGLFIALLKNSSIAAVIGAQEMMYRSESLITDTATPIPIFLGIAAGYLIFTIPSGAFIRVLERRLAIRR